MKEIDSILKKLLEQDKNEKLALNNIKNKSIIKYQSKKPLIN
jgi:hypothetical protein